MNWGIHVVFMWCILVLLQSNPENTVGVLTMAGKGPRVLITPTNDLGKILQALHGNS
jgi:hypothetical protein